MPQHTKREMQNHTFLAHSGAKTLLEPAVSTLIPLVFVDRAVSLKATCVNMVFAHRSPEESFAAIAGRSAIVLAGRSIKTDGAIWTDA